MTRAPTFQPKATTIAKPCRLGRSFMEVAMTIDIEQLKADIEAGTPGPWMPPHFSDDSHSCGCMSILGEYGGMGSIATIDVCEADDFPWGDDIGPNVEQAKANARRIARVPDLEAEVIRLTERLHLYEGKESTAKTPVGFDGVASEMSGTIQHQAARIAALEAKVKAADELAVVLEVVTGQEWVDDNPLELVVAASEALAAYREVQS